MCGSCKRVWPLTEYAVQRATPDGLQYWCLRCTRAASRSRRARLAGDNGASGQAGRRETAAAPRRTVGAGQQRDAAAVRRERLRSRTDAERAADTARLRPDGIKTCLRCRVVLPLSAFGQHRTAPDALQSYCRVCTRAASQVSRARRSAQATAAHRD